MADAKICSDPYSSVCYQSGSSSNVNECICCTDLNSKLKSLQNEISSLNLIINVLLKELTPSAATAGMDIRVSTSCGNPVNQVDHEKQTCTEWIEAIYKRRYNQNIPLTLDDFPGNQPVPTSNRYAQLHNLHDSTGDVNNSTSFNENRLLRISPNVHRHKEANRNRTRHLYNIPTLIKGKIYPTDAGKSANGTTNKNGQHVDEPAVKDPPSTGIEQTQSSTKHRARVVILGDSHLKGCTERIDCYLGDAFQTSGWIKPGAPAAEIVDEPTRDLVSLNKSDVIVISAEANDVHKSNSKVALEKTIKFIQNNSHTNIILLQTPHRYDLVEY